MRRWFCLYTESSWAQHISTASSENPINIKLKSNNATSWHENYSVGMVECFVTTDWCRMKISGFKTYSLMLMSIQSSVDNRAHLKS